MCVCVGVAVAVAVQSWWERGRGALLSSFISHLFPKSMDLLLSHFSTHSIYRTLELRSVLDDLVCFCAETCINVYVCVS